jgi:hypothetical protein
MVISSLPEILFDFEIAVFALFASGCAGQGSISLWSELD